MGHGPACDQVGAAGLPVVAGALAVCLAQPAGSGCERTSQAHRAPELLRRGALRRRCVASRIDGDAEAAYG